jgi:hypothetical protein
MSPSKEARQFYDGLIADLEAKRSQSSAEEQSFGAHRSMSRPELLEWLKFQCWYEIESCRFIGSWLNDTPEPEALVGLCRQIADEARHYKIVLAHIHSLGGSMEGWKPEPEWVEWIQKFYATDGKDTLERMAAHNIAGEIGAMNAFNDLMNRVPEATQRMLKRIMPDEKFHVALGRAIVLRYATEEEKQEKVTRRVWQAFANEQRSRRAFERRLHALGIAA